MIKQTPGKIYLADQRGHLETTQWQRFSIFNFEDYYQEPKKPFGSLYVVNEETLAAAQSITYNVDQASHIILIPITGSVNVKAKHCNPVTVEVSELLVITVPANSIIQFTNPYPEDTIQLLHLRIQAKELVNAVTWRLLPFNLDLPDNPLAEVISAAELQDNPVYPFTLSLGRFAGRQEINFPLKFKNQLFFAFVIAGAFEAAGKLLHEKDGLALWDTDEVELEALSHNALILIITLEKPVNQD